MTFQKSTLNNGLRVILAPVPNNNTVTILILTATGSKYETKEISGISHFLEHMCFKGTTKRPSAEAISKELDAIGGEFNAFTSKEYTGYYAKVRSQHADIALDVVSDIFLHQLLKPEEIEREKGVICEEINLYRDTPTEYIGDLFEELLYGDQPAGWPVVGNKEEISKLKREHFIEYLNSHYTAKNSVVILGGDKAEILRLTSSLDSYFHDVKTLPASPKAAAKESQDKPAVKLMFKNTDQAHIALGVRGYNLFDPRRYSLAVLSTILGGSMSSRLFLSVREREGLAYYIRTVNEHYTDTGYLATFAGIKQSRLNDALSIILKEYKTIREKKVSAEELQKAKEYIKGKLTLRLEGSDEVASFFGVQEILSSEPLLLEQIFAKIEAVTQEDIQNAAKDIFKPERLNLALIGAFKNDREFVKVLEGF
jgi:predicted Zn-dependent peptidase